MKRKPSVGETLYMLNVGNNARRQEQVLRPVQVLKVGRKYFTVSEPEYKDRDWMHERFFIENWNHDAGGYSANWAIYESEQEYLEKVERSVTISFLRGFFDWRDCYKLKTETLIAIKRLVENDQS